VRLYRASNGPPITPEEQNPIGAGGEARVYPVSGDPCRVAKLYHAPTGVHARKLAAMLAAPPVDPTARQKHASIAWPVDLLLSAPAARAWGSSCRA
jgi:DNA-binding helix-hairpin-helix protein with protein kinase domain